MSEAIAAVKLDQPTALEGLLAHHKGDRPVTVVMEIDAALAREMLGRNHINRAVRLSHVGYFVRELQAGRFQLTHQGVALDSTGHMLDGQHRLRAILESGIPAAMCVTFNLTRDAFKVIDFGNVPRTLADVTGLPSRSVQAVNYLFRFVHGGGLAKFNVDQFAPYWITFGGPASGLNEFCSTTVRNITRAQVRAAAVYASKIAEDDTYAFVCFRTMVMLDARAMTPILASYYKQLTSEKLSPVEIFVRGVTAFDPAKSDLGTVVIRDFERRATELRASVEAIVAAHRGQVWKIR